MTSRTRHRLGLQLVGIALLLFPANSSACVCPSSPDCKYTYGTSGNDTLFGSSTLKDLDVIPFLPSLVYAGFHIQTQTGLGGGNAKIDNFRVLSTP